MKTTIFKYIIIPVLLITLISCDDFLAEEPIGVVSPEVFFKTESDFNLAVLGAYGTLSARELYGWHMPVTQAGLTYELQTTASRPEYLLNYDGTYTSTGYFWEAYYRLINQCNLILAKIEEVSIDEQVKTELKGETLFLRGLAYFDLVRLYGDVPLHLKPKVKL